MNPASVSVDLDNLWCYLKTQGEPGWETYPSYLDQVVPRILECFEKAGVDATFFVVGRDAARAENWSALRAVAEAGHEIANHSFDHDVALSRCSRHELHREFSRSEEAIQDATGRLPFGFRGPGFGSSALLKEVLYHRGYRYDASNLPTFLGPVARVYFHWCSRLSAEEKAKRSSLYGGLGNGFAPLGPHVIDGDLMEVPVTTMPLLRTPVHLSYLLFLARHSEALARLYWRVALSLCQVSGIGPSLLLHPTDFLDLQDVPEMGFFPAMEVSAARKITLVDHVLQTVQQRWRLGTVASHAAAHAPARQVPQPGWVPA